MRYVLVPSAKCAPPDLPNFGDIPMVLYPINGNTMLHHIVNSFSDSKIVVGGYEEIGRLKKHLSRDKYKDVQLVKLPKLLDLGYTVKAMLDEISFTDKDTLIINLADTLVDNQLDGDSIAYVREESISKKWTYIVENKGVIEEIINKKEYVNPDKRMLLFVGVVSISDIPHFYECLKKWIGKDGVSLFNALQEYSLAHPFDFVEALHWLDCGHPDEYFNSQLSVKAREFNHMSFDKNRGILKKTSSDEKKFKGEIEWYSKLPPQIAYVAPRIFSYSLNPNNLFVEMEFYSYPTILELYLYGHLDMSEWDKILGKIKFILDDFARFKINDDGIKESLCDMYCVKTVERLEKLRQDQNFSRFFDEYIIVNGVRYRNLSQIIEMMPSIVKEHLMSKNEFCIIHGDLCFANMLIDDKHNFVKLIDPRGNFGKYDIYGDQRYEIAKLFHSVDGKYDYIIKDMFELDVNENDIEFKIIDERPFSLFELMKKRFAPLIGDEEKNIEIIEALLFLSMIPLHAENPRHQYAMLATGLEILNRHIDITIKE